MKIIVTCGMCGSQVNIQSVIDIERNTALRMLRGIRDRMYNDLQVEGVPPNECSIEGLWELSKEKWNENSTP